MKRCLVCLILMFMCVAMVMVGCEKKTPKESLLRDLSFMVAQESEMPAQEQTLEQPTYESEEEQWGEQEESEQEESEQEEEQVPEGC